MTSIPCSVVYGTPTNPVAAVINNEGNYEVFDRTIR